MHKRLGGPERGPIHHLEAGRHDARGDDASDRVGAAPDIIERGHDQFDTLGQRYQPDRCLDDDAKHAFGARQQRQQRESRRLTQRRADGNEFAVPGSDHQLQQVVDREAVLEAVDAAGILRDVAADGARELRRRVRRVEEPVRGCGVRDREIGDAGLDPGEAPSGIHFENAVQSRQHQQDAAFHRQCAAGQAGAGASRHDRDAVPGCGPQHREYLVHAAGQRDEIGCSPVGGERVAFECDTGFGCREDGVRAECSPELADQRRVRPHVPTLRHHRPCRPAGYPRACVRTGPPSPRPGPGSGRSRALPDRECRVRARPGCGCRCR